MVELKTGIKRLAIHVGSLHKGFPQKPSESRGDQGTLSTSSVLLP